MKQVCRGSITVLGEAGVGKKTFIHTFVEDPLSTNNELRKSIILEGRLLDFSFMSLDPWYLRQEAPAYNYGDRLERFFDMINTTTDGVVFLYDVTSRQSFEYVMKAYKYFYMCRPTTPRWEYKFRSRTQGAGNEYTAVKRRFGCVLVGNKTNLAEKGKKREVDPVLVESWANSQGIEWLEADCAAMEPVKVVVKALARSLLIADRRDAEDIEDLKKEAEKSRSWNDRSSNDLWDTFLE